MTGGLIRAVYRWPIVCPIIVPSKDDVTRERTLVAIIRPPYRCPFVVHGIR